MAAAVMSSTTGLKSNQKELIRVARGPIVTLSPGSALFGYNPKFDIGWYLYYYFNLICQSIFCSIRIVR